MRAHSIYSDPKPKAQAEVVRRKPCPTCYAPMTQHVASGGYTCPTHGKPSKP